MSTLGHEALRIVAELSDADVPGGVLPRFRTVADALPDAVSVDDGEQAYTFAQLATRAAVVRNRVLAEMTDGDREQARPVAMLYSHNASAVAALFGILTSGRPVLVLDPRTPAPRLAGLVERSGARIVLTDTACEPTAAQIAGQVLVDGPQGAIADDAELVAQMWATPIDPEQTAAVAFTSGSTGRPKIVVNDHRLLVRDAYNNSVGTGCYGKDDVVAHSLPMAFHAGLMATVAGVLTGTTMRLYDVRSRGISGLAGWIADSGVHVVQASPAILRAFVASRPTRAQLATLRSVTIAGEAAYGPDIEAVRALLPAGCVVRNRYGSSETSLIAEYAVPSNHPRLTGALPVGRPVGDTVVVLVGEDGEPVAAGEPGVVTVTSPAPARGYFGDEAATAERFRDNEDGTRTFRSNDVGVFTPEGDLRLLGRRDHSVKIRGYMVEPGEIDVVLFGLPEVREAVTVGMARSPEDPVKRLVSYIVSTADNVSAAAVRRVLHAELPSYMVPETIVFLDELPRTERGKLDRAALPEAPVAVAGESTGTLSEWEQVVQAMWCTVLALPDVGRDDDFFELGGDSLAAEALMSLMVKELHVPEHEATTSALVQAPTLGGFAARMTRRAPEGDATLVPLRPQGSRPPLFIATGGGGLGVAMVPIVRHLDEDQPVYALQSYGLESRGLPDWSVRRAARRNIATIRSVQPHGPYHLAGHSFGGIVALEMAHQLRRAGEEVAILIEMDSFPPDGRNHNPAPEGSLAKRAKDLLGVATTGLRGTPGGDQYWRFWRQSNILHRRYRCAPWDGEALVLVADSPEREQRSGWPGYLSGRWRMVEIPGDHVSMLRDPYAETTAARIAEALAGVQERRLHHAS